jgi:hypothetical protein
LYYLVVSEFPLHFPQYYQCFAEVITGKKGLKMGVFPLIRNHGSLPLKRLGGQWISGICQSPLDGILDGYKCRRSSAVEQSIRNRQVKSSNLFVGFYLPKHTFPNTIKRGETLCR